MICSQQIFSRPVFCSVLKSLYSSPKQWQIYPQSYSLFIQYLFFVDQLESDMKYHIFHDFRNSTIYEKKSCNPFRDIQKLKLLANFDVNLKSSPGAVMN